MAIDEVEDNIAGRWTSEFGDAAVCSEISGNWALVSCDESRFTRISTRESSADMAIDEVEDDKAARWTTEPLLSETMVS